MQIANDKNNWQVCVGGCRAGQCTPCCGTMTYNDPTPSVINPTSFQFGELEWGQTLHNTTQHNHGTTRKIIILAVCRAYWWQEGTNRSGKINEITRCNGLLGCDVPLPIDGDRGNRKTKRSILGGRNNYYEYKGESWHWNTCTRQSICIDKHII